MIESENTIILTRRESLRLLELLENPPARNEKFLQAQARYRGEAELIPQGERFCEKRHE